MKMSVPLIISLILLSCSSRSNLEEIARLNSENSKLRLEINSLRKGKDSRGKYVKEISTLADDVYQELMAIDTGYITLYSGEMERIEKTELERKLFEMLEKIDQMKKLIAERHKLVMELELTRNEKEIFERLTKHLLEKLDHKRNEINILTKNIFDLRERILDLKEKDVNLKNDMLITSRKVTILEEAIQRLEGNYKSEREKNNMKYFILVTNKKMKKCGECKDSCIEINAKNYKVLSTHLSSSYTIIDRTKRNHVLEILDREKFWHNTKFLIIFCKE